MTRPPDPGLLSAAEKDALIAALLARVEELLARVARLEAENAELRAKLALPPKTPGNSSTPPSQGHKAKGDGSGSRRKSKAHPGAHRALHPNPTRHEVVRAQRCPHCRTDVSDVAQIAMQAYDRIELPEIEPEVTRVTLHGGVCPCCITVTASIFFAGWRRS